MDLRRAGEFVFGVAVLSCGGLFLALAVGRLSAPVVDTTARNGPVVALSTAVPVSTTAPAAIAAPVAVPLPARAPATMVAVARPPVSSAPRARRMTSTIPSNAIRSPRVARASRPSATPVREIALAEKARAGVAPIRVAAPTPHFSRAVSARSMPSRVVVSKGNALSSVALAPVSMRKRPDAKTRTFLQTQLADGPQSRASIRNKPLASASLGDAIASSRKLAMRPALRHRYGVAYVHIRPKAERTPEPPIGYDAHPGLLRSEGPSVVAPSVAPIQVELETTHLER